MFEEMMQAIAAKESQKKVMEKSIALSGYDKVDLWISDDEEQIILSTGKAKPGNFSGVILFNRGEAFSGTRCGRTSKAFVKAKFKPLPLNHPLRQHVGNFPLITEPMQRVEE